MSTDDVANTEKGADSDQAPNEADVDSSDESTVPDAPRKRDVLRYVEWAGLALCVLLVIVAGLRVYSGIGAFISIWVASKFEPIVSAGFNLAVLLAAAYGAAVLSRRLTATE